MPLFLKELADLRWRFLILIILLLGLAYLILGHYELFVSMIDIQEIEQAIQQAPWIKRFYGEQNILHELQQIMDNKQLYIWSQWFAKNLLQLVLLAVILFGFSTFAREREQGTLHFLMANCSRKEIFAAKLAAGSVCTLLFCALGAWLPAILAPLYDFAFTSSQAVQYGVQLTAAALFLYSIVWFLSLVSTDVVKPLLGSIVIFALLSVAGRIDALQSLYTYRYMAGTDIFFTGQIHWPAVLVLLLLTTILLYGSWKYFEQMDI